MVFLPREPVKLIGLDAELLGVVIAVVDKKLDILRFIEDDIHINLRLLERQVDNASLRLN